MSMMRHQKLVSATFVSDILLLPLLAFGKKREGTVLIVLPY